MELFLIMLGGAVLLWFTVELMVAPLMRADKSYLDKVNGL